MHFHTNESQKITYTLQYLFFHNGNQWVTLHLYGIQMHTLGQYICHKWDIFLPYITEVLNKHAVNRA